MNTVTERLSVLLEQLNWSNYRLAKEGEFSKSSVSNWIMGKTKPEKSKIEVIAMVTGANKEWLLTGEGPMFKTKDTDVDREAGMMPVEVPNNHPTNKLYLQTRNGMKYYEMAPGRYIIRVPLVPYDAYARFTNECELQMDREEWEEVDFEADRIGMGNYMAFRVRGDSMDDGTKRGISQGEILLVRELEQIFWKDQLRYHKYPFWVISYDNSILVKQIINQDLQTGDITCHSLNPSPEYRDFNVNLNEVQRLFNVIKVKIPDREF